MDTLNGGKDVAVTMADGTTQTIKVLQIPLRKYEAAFLHLDDEIGMTAFMCDKPKTWAYDLAPESYETLRAAVQEINQKGFFAYADRKQALVIQRLNSMKPEMLRAAAESVSKPSQPGSRPRAA